MLFTSVQNSLMADSDIEHRCPQHVASVVGGEEEARLHLVEGPKRWGAERRGGETLRWQGEEVAG